MSPTRPDRFDVAVIGGSVAGAVCAAILARAGARVTLVYGVEARRSTVELLSGRARWLLRNLDLPAGEGVEINRTISHWGGALPQTREAMFDPYGPGLAIERASLDLRLREAATSHGASVLAARARALSRASCAWQIGSDKGIITAANVVLATGTIHSPLIPRDSRIVVDQIAFLARGLRRSVPRPKSVAAGNAALNVDDTLRVEATDIGWWYALPAPDGSAFVGVCTQERPRAADRVCLVSAGIEADAPDFDVRRCDVGRLGHRRTGPHVPPCGGCELDCRRQRRVQSGSALRRGPMVRLADRARGRGGPDGLAIRGGLSGVDRRRDDCPPNASASGGCLSWGQGSADGCPGRRSKMSARQH